MSRVKFNVNSEYAYLQNFKVLQSMRLSHIRLNVETTVLISAPFPSRHLRKAPSRQAHPGRAAHQMPHAG